MRKSSRLTPLDDTYPTCHSTYVILKIYPAFELAADISQLLGIVPTHVQEKNDIVQNSIGKSRIIPRAGWFLSSEGQVSSLDVRDHLNWLLKKIVPAQRELIVAQEWDGILISVSCSWWSRSGHGGPTLWPEQMTMLAKLNLECSFDIYFVDDEAG
jgi:hypothetical protein